jgi:hypothetical protein
MLRGSPPNAYSKLVALPDRGHSRMRTVSDAWRGDYLHKTNFLPTYSSRSIFFSFFPVRRFTTHNFLGYAPSFLSSFSRIGGINSWKTDSSAFIMTFAHRSPFSLKTVDRLASSTGRYFSSFHESKKNIVFTEKETNLKGGLEEDIRQQMLKTNPLEHPRELLKHIEKEDIYRYYCIVLPEITF